jgi:site-specific DNA recombinase
MKAAIYARKSNEERGKEAQAKSVAVQIAEATRYAERRGWTVADEHVYSDDAISGAVENRPGLTRFLDAIEKGRAPFQVLVVSEQSRLMRDTLPTLTLIKRIEENGVQIHGYLDDRQITLAQDSDEIEQFIKAWSGSQERKKAGQRSRVVAKRTVEAGRRHGGKLYGYRDIIGTPEPEQAEVVRSIFEQRAAGVGLYRICRQLEKDGVPTVRGKGWYVSQVQSIIRNTTYKGLLTWGAERRTKKKGKIVIEKSPENIITKPAPQYRLVSDKLWNDANQVSDQSAANTWRGADGRLKTRTTTRSPFLLSPFLACGVCGGSMHAKQSGRGKDKRWLYACTTRHLRGSKACANGRGIRVEYADKAIIESFESALVGSVVMAELETILGERRKRMLDPKPLQAEANRLKAEIKRLVNALAAGDMEDVRDAIQERKAKLEHIEGTLSGIGAVGDFDLAEFAERVTPILTDWRTHLRKNVVTAQAVLRKILPERMKVTPTTSGSFRVQGSANYTAVLKECGLDAVQAMLVEVAKLEGSRS